MLGCAVRRELLEQWSKVTHEFSKAVSAIKEHVSGKQFIHSMRLTEEARLKADNARLSLEMHGAEYGCRAFRVIVSRHVCVAAAGLGEATRLVPFFSSRILTKR
jgi:hypothetical protein